MRIEIVREGVGQRFLRRPQDFSIIVVERKLKTLKLAKEFAHYGRSIRWMHGNAYQLLQRHTIPHIYFVLA